MSEGGRVPQMESATTTLAPTARIPLHVNADGGITAPALEISPADGLLYLRQMVGPQGLLWHTPNIALGALVVGLAVLLLAVRRLRRVQARGRAYCRRCNYELTPPLAEMAADRRVRVPDGHARCPECGVELGRRPPVAGRPRWRRARPWLAMAAVLLFGGATALWWSLEPYRAGAWGVTPWPGQWMVKLAPKLAMQRTSAVIEQDAVRISRWRLRDGRHAGDIGTVALWNHENAGLSPAGDHYVYLEYPRDMSRVTIVVADTRTNRKRRITLSNPGWGMLAGFTRDGRGVYIQRTVHKHDQQACDFILERYDLESLTPTEIAREPYKLPFNPTYNAYTTPNSYFLVDDSSGVPAWVLVLLRAQGPNGPVSGEVRTGGARPAKQHVFEASGTSFYEPRLGVDGRAVGVPMHPTGSITRIDLDTGETTTSAPGQRTYASPDGRRTLNSSGAGFELLDVDAGAVIARLNDGASISMLTEPKFSDDGRWVACAVFSFPTRNTPVSNGEPCVLVWDLAPLDAAAPPARKP